MKFGWPISIFLHLSLAVAGLIVFSSSIEIDTENNIIPVELASISDLTNIRATVRPRDKPPVETEQPMTLKNPLDNADEQGEARNVDKVAETSTPDRPIDRTAEINLDEDKPEPQKAELDLNKYAAAVDKSRERQPEIGQQQTMKSEENFYVYANENQAAIGQGTSLTVNELDALKQKMYQCWRIPADAKNPSELVVTVRVKMRSDGVVSDARLHEPAKVKASSNPFMPVAARRAVNAVTNCGPYDFLPKEKYSAWQDMVLRFIPEV